MRLARPSHGGVVLAETALYRPGMTESELLAMPGCRRNSNLGDTRWYWTADLPSDFGVIHCTPFCKKEKLTTVSIAVGGFLHDGLTHRRHCDILEASLGPCTEEVEVKNPVYDCYPPPFTKIPVWKLPWGDVVATYNWRWDYCEIDVHYKK